MSTKFNPAANLVWYEVSKLGHNTLENMLKSMTQRAGISPHLTNHSLRATTVTVLASNNVETRQIKAVTGHRSDNSIQSYCQKPTLDQFKQMSSALTAFVNGEAEKNVQGEAEENVQGEAKEIQSEGLHVVNEMPPVSRSLAISAIPINTSHENFFQSALNPGAILPAGNLHGCTFTFNVNAHNNN